MAVNKEAKVWEEFDQYEKAVLLSGTVDHSETYTQKQERIAKLCAPGNHLAFFKYYFGNYAKSDFAPWHKKFADKSAGKKRGVYTVAAYRSGAKSALFQMIGLYNVLTGVKKTTIMASITSGTAKNLLRKWKIQLEKNPRIINDFGVQVGNKWTEEVFITTSGASFYAFGTGENPRGIGTEELRPDQIFIDDIDDDEQSRNPERVEYAYNWVKGSLLGTFDVSDPGTVYAGSNLYAEKMVVKEIINKHSDFHVRADLLEKTKKDLSGEIVKCEKEIAKLELANSQEEGQLKQLRIYRIMREYLLKGMWPHWECRQSMYDACYSIEEKGSVTAQGEYFNEVVTLGKVFKKEWIQDKAIAKLKDYQALEVYIDPSWKATTTSDTKALVLIGKYKHEYHIIKAFCAIATTRELWGWAYQVYKMLLDGGVMANFRMEANFAQDLILEDLQDIGASMGFMLPISPDDRKKTDKEQRITATSALFERGQVYFNAAESTNYHMVALKTQYQAFGPKCKTPVDGPDACEGAFFYLVQAAVSKIEEWIFNETPYPTRGL